MANIEKILLPDVGDFDDIEVIEVIISVGDKIEKDDSIVTLESDKATMEIPSPFTGKIKSVSVKVGDRISEGTILAEIEAAESVASEPVSTESEKPAEVIEQVPVEKQTPLVEAVKSAPGQAAMPDINTGDKKAVAHASPSIRKFARELGVDITQVSGSGTKGRVLILI